MGYIFTNLSEAYVSLHVLETYLLIIKICDTFNANAKLLA